MPLPSATATPASATAARPTQTPRIVYLPTRVPVTVVWTAEVTRIVNPDIEATQSALAEEWAATYLTPKPTTTPIPTPTPPLTDNLDTDAHSDTTQGTQAPTPEMAYVMDVISLKAGEAGHLLYSVGLDPALICGPVPSDPLDGGYVYATDPPPGSRIAKGSEVKVYVYQPCFGTQTPGAAATWDPTWAAMATELAATTPDPTSIACLGDLAVAVARGTMGPASAARTALACATSLPTS